MYSEKKYATRLRNSTGADLSLTAAANDANEEVFLSQMSVRRAGVLVITAVVSTAAVVVTFYKRVLVGSDAGRVALSPTLVIPAGTAANTMVFQEFDDIVFAPGQSLIAAVTTAAAGGGAAGTGFVLVEMYDNPEAPGNQPAMLESAGGPVLTP